MQKPHQFIFASLIIMVMCFANFSSVFSQKFVPESVLQDVPLHSSKLWHYQFVPHLKRELGIEDHKTSAYYRPLAHLITIFCYNSFGQATWLYHLFYFLLYFVCCVVIYIFLDTLFKDPRLALLTSLLFCVHPLNVSMVNFKASNASSLQMVAILLSILMFWYASQKISRFIFYSVLSAVFFVMALLCHETSILLPFYLVTTIYFLQRRSLKDSFSQCWLHFGILAIYLIFRISFVSLKTNVFDQFSAFDINIFEYAASLTKLLMWYLSKIITASDVVFVWATPAVREHVIAWNLLLACFWALAASAFIKRKKMPEPAWAVLWFVVGFLPLMAASLIKPNAGLVIEPHWLFIPSIGLFVLAAFGLLSLSGRFAKIVQYAFLSLIIVFLLGQSRSLNNLWGDPVRYNTYWFERSPQYKNIAFYLANAYLASGNEQKAQEYFYRAVEDTQTDWEIYNNLGLIEFNHGRLDKAMVHFNRAAEIFPQSSAVSNNLGLIWLQKNDIAQASNYFLKAAAYNRLIPEPRLNLAGVYKKQGNLPEALRLYEEILGVEFNQAETLLNLVDLYLSMGDYPKAEALAEKILKASGNTGLLINVGGIFGSRGYAEVAFKFFVKTVQIDPGLKDGYLALGKWYGNQKDYDQAIVIWQRGLKLHPEEPQFKELILHVQGLQAKQFQN